MLADSAGGAPVSLSDRQQAAFVAHPGQVREELDRLAAADEATLMYDLDLTQPEPVRRLIAAAAFEGFVDPKITDDNFPVEAGGVVSVRFRVLSGRQLKQPASRWTFLSDVDRGYDVERMRRAGPAEGLLPFAMDHRLGRQRPVVVSVSIRGLHYAFVVCELGGHRRLDLLTAVVKFEPGCDFLGVVCA